MSVHVSFFVDSEHLTDWSVPAVPRKGEHVYFREKAGKVDGYSVKSVSWSLSEIMPSHVVAEVALEPIK